MICHKSMTGMWSRNKNRIGTSNWNSKILSGSLSNLPNISNFVKAARN
jgi:hypothetical protein